MRAFACCLIVLLGACKVAPADLSEADRAAIRAATDSFIANARARRDSVNALHYTENAAFMAPNVGIAEGRAAIRAQLAKFPLMTDFTLTPVEIDGQGDLAYVRGTYSFNIVGPDGHQVGEDRGKYLEVRRKQPDGKWLIVADIFNSDVPVGKLR